MTKLLSEQPTEQHRREMERQEQRLQIILSFDVEEHHRIEAATGLQIADHQKSHYDDRLEIATRWILDQLLHNEIRATFFIVGEIANSNPKLVRDIHAAGHEVGSHSWDHRRVHYFTPEAFRQDVRKSKDALEQVIGVPVVGYRAPTFSITRETAWALDILAEEGMLYDSSIFPVRHDRYGIPSAPRVPFLATGTEQTILELPLTTLRKFYTNWPIAGGGYFRLFPLYMLEMALYQIEQRCRPAVASLYFHPWEFDPEQDKLPLGRLNRFRTYVGVKRTQSRLKCLLKRFQFSRAIDVARRLLREKDHLKEVRFNCSWSMKASSLPVGSATGERFEV